MRIIDESLIPTGDAAYFKQGTWTHLQKAYKEAIDALAKCVIKDYNNTKVYILYGCVATGTNPGARTFTAGAVYYAGEVYLVPAASFTTTGSDVAVANITTVYNTTDYSVDPQTTPGGNTISIHAIRTIEISAGTSGSGDVDDFIDWLDAGVAHKNEFTNIASSVSVNNVFTVQTKSISKYVSGFTRVILQLISSTTITADSVLASGFAVPSSTELPIRAFYTVSGTTTAIDLILNSVGELRNITTLTYSATPYLLTIQFII